MGNSFTTWGRFLKDLPKRKKKRKEKKTEENRREEKRREEKRKGKDKKRKEKKKEKEKKKKRKKEKNINCAKGREDCSSEGNEGRERRIKIKIKKK